MAKSKLEVIAEAHRRINVLSVDESPSDDMITYAGDAADSLLIELNSRPHECKFFWTTDAVPEGVFRPFAWLLAVDLAAHYREPAEARARAVMRVLSFAYEDDRDEVRDSDLNGILSDAELAAAMRSIYY